MIRVIYELYTESAGFIKNEKNFSSLREYEHWCMYRAKINSHIIIMEVQYL